MVRRLGDIEGVREEAERFENALPADKRKRLGQFFTGLPLARLLAHLAFTPETSSVLDPMAGHGDLLDASGDASHHRKEVLARLDGIEIDKETAELCRARIEFIAPKNTALSLLVGSAFEPATVYKLPVRKYGLVITNPPYVRYQAQHGNGSPSELARRGLAAIIDSIVEADEQKLWRTLALGYSGLADLSVPAWILAALMVRPGGRLALVVPATWRTREYGDVVRYLMLRFFQLEWVVEDSQPGWFSKALVRTNLVVARRLTTEESLTPLSRRTTWPSARWLKVSPEAASADSLVGNAFESASPELLFARWLDSNTSDQRRGIHIRPFSLSEEWMALKRPISRRTWYQTLEAGNDDLPLFVQPKAPTSLLPEGLRAILGNEAPSLPVTTLEGAGIRTGQGLRTGCNRFFYVDALGTTDHGTTRVKSSAAFGEIEFEVPTSALRPVFRRQAELSLIETDSPLPGRVLDLRQWVLPEDEAAVLQAVETYRAGGKPIPQIMPQSLADYVRCAADTRLDDQGGKRVPELSAVCTNARSHKSGAVTPRFWYMLPGFKPRHQPSAFVPRVNHSTPWVECNLTVPALIDANFSTFWVTEKRWTPFAIKAFLNSAWSQFLMEALGTPMGGGALKLEAVQIKQMPMPVFSAEQRSQLDRHGRTLTRTNPSTLAAINAIILEAITSGRKGADNNAVVRMTEGTASLRQMRLRSAA